MKRIIRLNESDIRNIIKESLIEYGAVWNNDNGHTSLSVDKSPDVNNNTNKGIGIDTRIFGSDDMKK